MSFVHRVARAIARGTAIAVCPPADRRWINAMLAEAAEAPASFGSASAMWTVAFAALGARADAIMAAPLRWVAIIALHVAIVGALLSRTEIEYHGIDDDVCLRIAAAATVTLVAIVIGTLAAAVLRAPHHHNAA